jgi:hypothetical protein
MFTQPLTEMSTRNIKIIMFLGSEVRLVCRADNLTAIYEPIDDCLRSLMVRVAALQIQRSAFDSRRYQIFWEVVGLEQGPLSLVSTVEELLGRKSSGSGLENRNYGRKETSALTTRNPSIRQAAIARSVQFARGLKSQTLLLLLRNTTFILI